jgi:putative addiction module CopG family antidote
MSAVLTSENKRLIRRAIQSGRWNNESEVIRYAIHLVEREMQDCELRKLTPFGASELRQAAKRATADDVALDKRLGKASARHKPSPE